ncbi:unnamed protein product [Boreogadus saida]
MLSVHFSFNDVRRCAHSREMERFARPPFPSRAATTSAQSRADHACITGSAVSCQECHHPIKLLLLM